MSDARAGAKDGAHESARAMYIDHLDDDTSRKAKPSVSQSARQELTMNDPHGLATALPAASVSPLHVDVDGDTRHQLAPARTRAPSKRDALLKCAREHFAANGFVGTPIAAVAQSVRIRKSTFFHYFEDKNALYDAAVRAVLDELADHAANVSKTKGASFEQRLDALVDCTSRFLRTEASLPRLLLRAVVDEPSPQAVRPTPLDRLSGAFADVIQQGVDERRLGPCEPVSEAIAVITFIASQAATTSALTVPLPREGQRAGPPELRHAEMQRRVRALLPPT